VEEDKLLCQPPPGNVISPPPRCPGVRTPGQERKPPRKDGMEQIIHIQNSQISRNDLDVVIVGLEVACGGNRIVITESFDLVVTDERQATALKALFSGARGSVNQGAKTGHKPSNTTKVKRSYTFVATGEAITAQALNKRLEAQDDQLVGCECTNPKGDRFIIRPGKSPEKPYRQMMAIPRPEPA
jgi:hypothetical protein